MDVIEEDTLIIACDNIDEYDVHDERRLGETIEKERSEKTQLCSDKHFLLLLADERDYLSPTWDTHVAGKLIKYQRAQFSICAL